MLRKTTREYIDKKTITVVNQAVDCALQGICYGLYVNDKLSIEVETDWRNGTLRHPEIKKFKIPGPGGRLLGKHELKALIEEPLQRLLPSEKFSGKGFYRVNNGELSGKPRFTE